MASMQMASLERWAPYVLSIVRIVFALAFIEYGLEKFFGFPGPGPEMTPLFWVQGVIEIVGGSLLLVGAYTRPVAFILSGDMAVAYFITYVPRSFYPAVSGGGEALQFCFLFFYLVFAGGGPLSLDATLLKRD